MCIEAVRIEPLSLMYVHDHFKMQEICNEAVKENPYTLRFVPDLFKTPEMCEMGVEEDQLSLDLLITLIPKRYLMMQWGEILLPWSVSLISL